MWDVVRWIVWGVFVAGSGLLLIVHLALAGLWIAKRDNSPSPIPAIGFVLALIAFVVLPDRDDHPMFLLATVIAGGGDFVWMTAAAIVDVIRRPSPK